MDDDPQAIKVLANHVEKTPFLTLINTFTESVNALAFLQDTSTDLIFSDVEMPDLTGIELLEILNNRCQVILSTGHAEYALESYEHDIVDFLLKPVSFDRFLKAAQKAYRQSMSPVITGSSEEFLMVKTEGKGRMRRVKINDIHYIEGLKNYVSIYTQNDRIITLVNIRDLEKRLPASNFFRVHKSYIVAIDKINAIDGNQIILDNNLKSQKVIPIGATYRPFFFHIFQSQLISRK
ncbi:MAG: LytR/AlgR family response regulator transcription factor [Cyclobacteriaceae bacterium]